LRKITVVIQRHRGCKFYIIKWHANHRRADSSLVEENICEVSQIIWKTEWTNTKVIYLQDEILLLTEIKKNYTCKSCAMDCLKSVAYGMVCDLEKSYPKLWDMNRQVNSEWIRKFEERYKNEISKFSDDCKKQNTAKGRPTILAKEERLLLTQLQEMDCCKCKNCV